MPVFGNQVGKVIFTGIFKVLNQASPKWTVIKDQQISTLFDGTANPTNWKDFFIEAVGTSIQNEMIMRGSYCEDLEETLKEFKDDGSTWRDLESHIMANKENVTVEWTS